MSDFEVESKGDTPSHHVAWGLVTGGLGFFVPNNDVYVVKNTETGDRFRVGARDADELGQKIADGDMDKL